jgi:hypothetical protein
MLEIEPRILSMLQSGLPLTFTPGIWFLEIGSQYIAQASLELVFLPPACWNDKTRPPHLAESDFFFLKIHIFISIY